LNFLRSCASKSADLASSREQNKNLRRQFLLFCSSGHLEIAIKLEPPLFNEIFGGLEEFNLLSRNISIPIGRSADKSERNEKSLDQAAAALSKSTHPSIDLAASLFCSICLCVCQKFVIYFHCRD